MTREALESNFTAYVIVILADCMHVCVYARLYLLEIELRIAPEGSHILMPDIQFLELFVKD